MLHTWATQDCSLFANALVYSPPRALRAFPRPGRVGGTSASMTLVRVRPVFESRSQHNSYTPATFFSGALRAPRFSRKKGSNFFRRALRAIFEVFPVFPTEKGSKIRVRYARRGFFYSPPETIKCVSCTLVVDSSTAMSVAELTAPSPTLARLPARA